MKKRSTKRSEDILIAGFGGQGIAFLGSVIARAAVLENKHVTFIRSYGAEMRGGTAHCMVRLSGEDIASPVFKNASVAIIMNKPSLDKFKKRVDKNGVLSADMTKRMNLTEKALRLGSIKAANIIALGQALRKKQFVKVSSVEKVLCQVLKDKRDLLAINLKALKAGYENG